MKKVKKIGVALLVILFVFHYSVGAETDGPNSKHEVDIAVETPSGSYLYDVKDMKPGDWMPRTVVVQNNGEKSFDYTTSIHFESGEDLFEILQLEISDANGELYNGKLADFEELSLRNLQPGTEEEIHFTVTFPSDASNIYQGLETKFKFVFTAENFDTPIDNGDNGTSDGNEQPVSGDADDTNDKQTDTSKDSSLPDTATNSFNFLMFGAILLAVGGGIYLKKRRKVSE
ncbi:LPXTG cell wall anchor domain-containing protein [Salirhabdus sp. Marseille-P4669]|uniref:LPXTG cell wall anchor domain-containing protein n=1 Tax=Salirhabdus sp. Marseille-P4669 TaxID=2042310 RepID=UPI000C7DDF0B|nr:LPXTG cell wall anchor domain-containing protein [Salirhabdus sp. Marseille-P4669]